MDGAGPTLGAVGADGRPMSIPVAPPGPSGVAGAALDQTRELAQGVNALVSQLRGEQTVVRQWLDEQSTQSALRHEDVTQRLDDVKSRLSRQDG
jgi:hypothetical protein